MSAVFFPDRKSPTLPATFATVAFKSEEVLTFFSRVGFSAASRIASATCSGSSCGLGNFGSLSVTLRACCGNGVSVAPGWMRDRHRGLVHLLGLHPQHV